MNKKFDSIIIRPFEPSDTDALISLFQLSVRNGAAEDYTHEQRLAWAPGNIDRDQWLTKRLSRPTWVAVIDSQIVGFTDLEFDGHIDMLYVHPDFHRRGIASILVGKVHDAASQQAVNRLFTEASITARPAFEKFGFSIIQEQTVHRNGQDFINFQMEKYL